MNNQFFFYKLSEKIGKPVYKLYISPSVYLAVYFITVGSHRPCCPGYTLWLCHKS